MFNIVILFLILIGLVLHRYLTSFWEQGILPYSMGFLLFANIFVVIYLVNFIWIFGFIVGAVVFLLTFLQMVYSSFLWPFLLPHLVSLHKKPRIPKVNPLVVGLWSYIVIGLGLLSIVNFFISDYASLTKNIIESFGGSYIMPIIWIVGVAILSNIIRSFVLFKYLKKDGVNNKE